MDKRPVVTTENFLRSGARFRLNLSLQRVFGAPTREQWTVAPALVLGDLHN